MDIRVLQYFLTVAQEESITKAAIRLNMTQPPLSRQMKELEEEVGKQLLVRGAKKVTLTEDGLLLKSRAEELVELFEKTKQELSVSDQDVAGNICIGAGETRQISFLAQAAHCLQSKHTKIHYHLYSGDAERIMERLDKGLIDFGLVIGTVDISKYDFLRLPVKDIWGVLMPKSDPLAGKEFVTPEDLWDKPLIFSHQASESSEMIQWLGRDIERLNVVAAYDLLFNASVFAENGFGYVIGLEGIICTDSNHDLTFRPLLPRLEAELCVVWKRHQVFSKAAKMFLQYMKNILEGK